jgi:hypothetical protein
MRWRSASAGSATIEDAWYKLAPLGDIVERFIRAHPRDFFA